MNIPLHVLSGLHGECATTLCRFWITPLVCNIILDRFPRTSCPQNGRQNDSSVVLENLTWFNTMIECSHPVGMARFVQYILIFGDGLEKRGFVTFRRICLPNWTSVNFTQVSGSSSVRLLSLHCWASDWNSTQRRNLGLKYTAQLSSSFREYPFVMQ